MAPSMRDAGPFVLRDGRRFGFARFGAASGPVVFYCAGTMGSRREARLFDEAGRRIGVTVVGVDRPGHGDSEPHVPRRFAAFADDVAQLADHLGVARFGLVGWSGGGAHAAAVASVLGARVSRLSLLCPASPPDAMGVQADRPFSTRLTIALVRWTVLHVWLLAAFLRLIVRRSGVRLFERLGRASKVPGDRKALENPSFRELLATSWAEGTRQGSRAIARDVALQLRTWDVTPTDPGCPVDLWFGKRDGTTPPSIALYYGSLYRDARTTILEDEGHLLPGNHAEAILQGFAVTAA